MSRKYLFSCLSLVLAVFFIASPLVAMEGKQNLFQRFGNWIGIGNTTRKKKSNESKPETTGKPKSKEEVNRRKSFSNFGFLNNGFNASDTYGPFISIEELSEEGTQPNSPNSQSTNVSSGIITGEQPVVEEAPSTVVENPSVPKPPKKPKKNMPKKPAIKVQPSIVDESVAVKETIKKPLPPKKPTKLSGPEVPSKVPPKKPAKKPLPSVPTKIVTEIPSDTVGNEASEQPSEEPIFFTEDILASGNEAVINDLIELFKKDFENARAFNDLAYKDTIKSKIGQQQHQVLEELYKKLLEGDFKSLRDAELAANSILEALGLSEHVQFTDKDHSFSLEGNFPVVNSSAFSDNPPVQENLSEPVRNDIPLQNLLEDLRIEPKAGTDAEWRQSKVKKLLNQLLFGALTEDQREQIRNRLDFLPK